MRKEEAVSLVLFWQTHNGGRKKKTTDDTPTHRACARYDPQLGRTWQPDPMANIREWVSPYSWVQNNPISRIDPTGAVDDEFLVSPNGKIEQIKKEGEDVVVMVDKKGNRTDEIQEIGENAQLINGNGRVQVLIVNDKEKGHQAFKTIAKHTKVEFAKIEYTENGTGDDKTAILTNGSRGEVSATEFAQGLDNNNLGVPTTIDHSHPGPYGWPSGFDRHTGEVSENTGDAKAAADYPQNSKGQPIIRNVYHPSSGKAYRYNNSKYNEEEDY